MAEIIPFDPDHEPFVCIAPHGEQYRVTFPNCPRFRDLERSFGEPWQALKYGLGFALGEEVALILWPPLIDILARGQPR